MQVKDIMSKKPDYISPDVTLKNVADEMLKRDIGFILIKENGQLLGAITDRDIIIRALANGKDPAKTLVKDVMTPNALFCYEDDDVQKAAQKMSDKQIRRLAVLDQNKQITGVISLGDIAVKGKNEQLTGQVLHEVCETTH